MSNYFSWFCHGEDFPVDDRPMLTVVDNPYREMVNDALRNKVDTIREEALNADEINQAPHPQVKAFFDMKWIPLGENSVATKNLRQNSSTGAIRRIFRRKWAFASEFGIFATESCRRK